MAGETATGLPEEPGKGDEGKTGPAYAATARFRQIDHASRDLEIISDMCQTELANLFSCLRAQLDGRRPEYMSACAKEFADSVVRKVTLATEIANSMVQSMHGNKGT